MIHDRCVNARLSVAMETATPWFARPADRTKTIPTIYEHLVSTVLNLSPSTGNCKLFAQKKRKSLSSYLVDVRLMALKGRKLSLTTPMECWEVYRYSCRLLARPQLAFWKSPNQNPCPICRFAYTLNSANKWRNWTRFFFIKRLQDFFERKFEIIFVHFDVSESNSYAWILQSYRVKPTTVIPSHSLYTSFV